MSRLLSSKEAAALLGVSLPTLYSYVSRGLVRSQDAPTGRRKLYQKEDLDRLLAIKEGRRNPRRAAAEALSWGDPVLDSAITLIRDEALYYRGQDVEQLAGAHSFEEVAGLIWLDDLTIGPRLFGEARRDLPPIVRKALSSLDLTDDLSRIQALLPVASAADPEAFAAAPEAAARVGARIIRLMAGMVAEGTPGQAAGGTVAGRLALAWASDQVVQISQTEMAAGLINTALVLIADHELNVSSFTVRCVASAGSGLYAALSAGLSALQGSLHGGATARVEAFLDEAQAIGDPVRTVRGRLERGESLPGFGHNLYAADPRARILLGELAAAYPGHPDLEMAAGLAAAVKAAGGEAPTIDLGLVALRRAAGLPRGAALTLFALGRSAGWVGHAIEQYQAGRLIRPRARYVGR